jgi:hypothetical protein
MIRTAANAAMLFDQFLIAPYIGDGSPVDQTVYYDELVSSEILDRIRRAAINCLPGYDAAPWDYRKGL